MSGPVLGQVWTQVKLPPAEKLVMLALADHAHIDGTSAKPGVARLSWMTDLSERTVQRALVSLVDMRLIEATAFANGGRSHVTEYTLHFDAVPPKAPYGSVDNLGTTSLKGDTSDAIKGDTSDAPDPQRVTNLQERVTTATLKGDNGDIFEQARKEVVLIEPKPEPTTNLRAKARVRARGQIQILDADFESLWITFPARHGKKADKGKAELAWRRLSKANRALALSAVANYRAACDGGGDLAKDCHRWLTNGCYQDWQEPAILSTNGHHPTRSQNQINADIAARRMGLNPADSDPFGGAPDEPWSRRTM